MKPLDIADKTLLFVSVVLFIIATLLYPRMTGIANMAYLAWVLTDFVRNYTYRDWQWFVLDFVWLGAGLFGLVQGYTVPSPVALLRLLPLSL